jgi:hypothetical protein
MKLLTTTLLLVTAPLLTVTSAIAAPAPDLIDITPITIARSEYATLTSRDWSSPINVRDGATTSAYARHIAYAGDRVEVLDRTVGRDGYMWFYVRFTVSNATGWIRGDFVALDSEYSRY